MGDEGVILRGVSVSGYEDGCARGTGEESSRAHSRRQQPQTTLIHMTTRTRNRRPIKEITEPQSRTLPKIHRFLQQRGLPPTMKELADILVISYSTAHAQVGQLVRKGFMIREHKKARGLAITDKGTEANRRHER